MNLYEGLLALPPSKDGVDTDPQEALSQQEDDAQIVSAAEKRLLESQAESIEMERLSTSLRKQTQTSSQAETIPVASSSTYPNTESIPASSQPYQRVLSHVHDFVTRVEATQSSLLAPTNVPNQKASFSPMRVPVSVLSMKEWESLTRLCVSADVHFE